VLAFSGCNASPGKTIKNHYDDFERGEDLLQNGILHFVFRLRQEIMKLKIMLAI